LILLGGAARVSVGVFFFFFFFFFFFGRRMSSREYNSMKHPRTDSEPSQPTVAVRQPPVHLRKGKEPLVVQAHLLARGQRRQLGAELLEPLRVGQQRRGRLGGG